MLLDACINRINNFITSSMSQPLIVNVNNGSQFNELISHFNVGGNRIISSKDYCKNDEMPQVDLVFDLISNADGIVFITNFTTYLRMYGEDELRKTLKTIINLSTRGKVVFISYQCEQYLSFTNPAQKNRVCLVDGEYQVIPQLIFISNSKFAPNASFINHGLPSIGNSVESLSRDKIFIVTNHLTTNFTNSLIPISAIKSSYEAVLLKDPIASGIDENFGSDEQWLWALEKLNSMHTWANLINSEFGNCENLNLIINSWTIFDDIQKWLYFIGLKLFGTKDNSCLTLAIKNSSNVKDFIRCIYRSIYDLDHSSSDFSHKYIERKKIIQALGSQEDEVVDYCALVRSKEENAIYYLTDATKLEREEIIDYLAEYGNRYSTQELIEILNTVFPDLSSYLLPYKFDSELLSKYFEMYRYMKVTNKISDEFLDIVNEQASKRDFISLLQPRTSEIENINIENAQAYFVDALGVEFLPFILKKCYEKDLHARVTVCYCELPSITELNKEFVEYFENKGVNVLDVKSIDEIKHKGNDDYDYRVTKTPKHLIRELEIIEELLDKIKAKITTGAFEKAIIVSDHGASRLAVINESDIVCGMELKGKHSGRCCPISEGDTKPLNSMEEKGYWVLTNYDRFKGGRKSNVEVHGGASLEEVVVPIIELIATPKDNEFIVTTPIVTASYKSEPVLKLFIKYPMDKISIVAEGTSYEGESDGKGNYEFVLSDFKRKKVGDYSFDVYSCNGIIASGLNFKLKKEGQNERKFF